MDIYKKLETKKLKRVVSYEHVLRSCFDLIQKVADKEEYHTVFEVPAYVVGLPLYNVSQCIAYIICQLRKQGFYVRFVPRQYLYISWKLEDIRAPGAVGTVGTVGNAGTGGGMAVITDPNRPLPQKAAGQRPPPVQAQAPRVEERMPPPPPLEPTGFGAGGFSMYESAPPVSSVQPMVVPMPTARPDTKTIHTDTLPVPIAGGGGAGRGRRGGRAAGPKAHGNTTLQAQAPLQAPVPEARIPFPPPLVYDPYDLMIEPSVSSVAPPSLLPQAPTRAEHAVKPSGKFILKLD